MSVDTDYISHIKKNGSNAGLEGMELTGKRSWYMRGRRKRKRKKKKKERERERDSRIILVTSNMSCCIDERIRRERL